MRNIDIADSRDMANGTVQPSYN